MPKIKNWSKRSNNVWINDENSEVIKVMEISNVEGWAVTHKSSLERRSQRFMTKKGFDSRSQAVDWARNWMKKHPKG